MHTIPSQAQMMLPLLHALHEHGGEARPREIYDQVAAALEVSGEDRNATITVNGRVINPFERRLRWTRQTAVLRGLISKEKDRVWTLTSTAHDKLQNIVAGHVVTFAISESGALLWGNAEDAVAMIEPESIQLIMTSPPYPLNRPKEYGNVSPDRWVGWMLEHLAQWKELLTADGSMMLNIGPCFRQGVAAQQLHKERLLIGAEDQLGIYLLQELTWFNPTKPSASMEFISKRRLRITQATEPVLWLSPNPNAFGNNRAVLRPYTKQGLRDIQKPRNGKRPSGFCFGSGSFQDRGGSIPPSLLNATSTGVDETRYRKAMQAVGREPHPALMPASVARFGIQLATAEGDTVLDPMCGSGTIPIEAMKIGRNGIGFDRSLRYLEGALLRSEIFGLPLQGTGIQ